MGVRKSCESKASFPSYAAAFKAARRGGKSYLGKYGTKSVYRCPVCHLWHLTGNDNVRNARLMKIERKKRVRHYEIAA